MAIGVIRGYRTVSYEAACLLAGSPPWDLEAEIHAEFYRWRAVYRIRGEDPLPKQIQVWRSRARSYLIAKWRERLAQPTAGIWSVEAVQPVLEDWFNREHGSLSFRLVQVLSGHGCFGKYLCRVAGREPTTACHHCSCIEDTAKHTLEDCPAWANERRVLVATTGYDLLLAILIRSMVGSESIWNAVVSFCEDVMSQKERAERERELESQLPMRRRRIGRRRNIFTLLHPP